MADDFIGSAPQVDAAEGGVVLIGGGQASYMAAMALRQGGYEAPITIVGEEPHLPYERPPLSKGILLGTAAIADTYLTTSENLASKGVEMVQATVATIDRGTRHIRTDKNEAFPYEHLVIATGGAAKKPELPGGVEIAVLRNLEDALSIQAQLRRGGRILVIGGGWIGLEVAASARKAGCEVALVEAAERFCVRSLPERPAHYLAALQKSHGVELYLGRTPISLERHQTGVRAVLDDGSIIEADFVIAGIGMKPRVELATECGLAVDAGIIIDENCRTSDPAIFAIGDVAQLCIDGQSTRIESWANANEQAAKVAATILGHAQPERQIPWFWSDQFDCNLQILGDVTAATSFTQTPPERDGSRSWFYFVEGRLVGIVAANRPRDIQIGKRIMSRNIAISPAALEDSGYDLATLLRNPPT